MGTGGDISYLIKLRDEFSGKLSGIQKQTKAFDEQVGGLKNTLKSVAGLMVGAFAVGGLIEFLHSAEEAEDKLEAAVMRVNTVLASTRHAAGLSGEAIEEQAKSLSRSITASRAEILDAQGMLLSFPEIKGKMFEKTTEAVADFATFFKTDMSSAALAIGKAMNNPAQGMMRLQRQGVAFTDQQKATVKQLQQQGKLMEAQGIILKELNREFGGQAKGFAMTDEGKLIMASKAMTDIKISVGKTVEQIKLSLIPMFKQLMAKFGEFIEFIKRNIPTFILLGKILLGIGAAFTIYTIGLKSVVLWTKAYSAALKIQEILQATALFGLKATIVEFYGLGSAIAATGIGALIVGLGLVVAKLISMRKEAADTRDMLSGLLNINKTYKEAQSKYSTYQSEMLHRKDLSGTAKSELLTNMQNQVAETQRLYEQQQEKLRQIKDHNISFLAQFQKASDKGEFSNFAENQMRKTIAEGNKQLGASQYIVSKYKRLIDGLGKSIMLLKKEGVKDLATSAGIGGDTTSLTKIESAAPKVFNVNITKMVESFNVTSNTIKEAAADVEKLMVDALANALNDVQITANI
jgi:archaellum component FlaC